MIGLYKVTVFELFQLNLKIQRLFIVFGVQFLYMKIINIYIFIVVIVL